MKKIFSIILLISLIVTLTACQDMEVRHDEKSIVKIPQRQDTPIKELSPEVKTAAIETKEITLKAEDNTKIAATFYETKGTQAIILLHMLNEDRSSWTEFAKELQKKYSVIAIDLRGHGDSSYEWNKFREEQFNKMILDVATAKDYLVEQGQTQIVIIGASIGANVALNYAATDPSIPTIILLSPGEVYRGITTIETITKYKKPILIVASEGDEYAATSSFTLNTKASNGKLIMYELGHHGTKMLGKDLGLEQEINDWLDKHLNSPKLSNVVNGNN